MLALEIKKSAKFDEEQDKFVHNSQQPDDKQNSQPAVRRNLEQKNVCDKIESLKIENENLRLDLSKQETKFQKRLKEITAR